MANGMKAWKGNGNTITIIFPESIEIVHEERRGLEMEYLNALNNASLLKWAVLI